MLFQQGFDPNWLWVVITGIVEYTVRLCFCCPGYCYIVILLLLLFLFWDLLAAQNSLGLWTCHMGMCVYIYNKISDYNLMYHIIQVYHGNVAWVTENQFGNYFNLISITSGLYDAVFMNWYLMKIKLEVNCARICKDDRINLNA